MIYIEDSSMSRVGSNLAFCCFSSISVSKLEPELQKKVSTMDAPVSTVYYNKGL